VTLTLSKRHVCRGSNTVSAAAVTANRHLRQPVINTAGTYTLGRRPTEA